jgi:hypothetical protein
MGRCRSRWRQEAGAGDAKGICENQRQDRRAIPTEKAGNQTQLGRWVSFLARPKNPASDMARQKDMIVGGRNFIDEMAAANGRDFICDQDIQDLWTQFNTPERRANDGRCKNQQGSRRHSSQDGDA